MSRKPSKESIRVAATPELLGSKRLVFKYVERLLWPSQTYYRPYGRFSSHLCTRGIAKTANNDYQPKGAALHVLSNIMQLNILSLTKGVTILLGVHMVYSGVLGATAPLTFADHFGIPTTASDLDAQAWVRVNTSRELGYGLAILALAFFREWRALGLLLLPVIPCALIDCYNQSNFGVGVWKGAAMNHGVAVPVLAPMSAVLFWYGPEKCLSSER
jgi:hypothetical protein